MRANVNRGNTPTGFISFDDQHETTISVAHIVEYFAALGDHKLRIVTAQTDESGESRMYTLDMSVEEMHAEIKRAAQVTP